MWRFSSCGKEGNVGPTQEEANAFYQNFSLKVDIIEGIQKWVVPKTGNYLIEAAGAAGTDACAENKGGKGAVIRSTFNLQVNSVLYILVGQQGTIPFSGWGGSGGGASIIAKEIRDSDSPPSNYGILIPADKSVAPLLIAGGGGGSGDCNNEASQKQGTDAYCDLNGGSTVSNIESGASSGAGFSSDATQGTKSLLSGGRGGSFTDQYGTSYGGFGGGGCSNNAGGGGGGYKGGSSAETGARGFGGSSFSENSPLFCEAKNTGSGYVLILYNHCYSVARSFCFSYIRYCLILMISNLI